jgi:hypothetical protein
MQTMGAAPSSYLPPASASVTGGLEERGCSHFFFA